MSEIDWSKAPEGATHYHDKLARPWLKKEPDGTVHFWECGEWACYGAQTAGEEHIRTAFPRPVWTGEGLPPVGTVCEWHGANHDGPNGWVYSESTVVGYSPCGLFVFMQKPSCWPVVERLDNCEFRPIRTPEQIAAEEREKAAKDMATLMTGHENHKGEWGCYVILGEILYDAGYRKQEQPK